jgi:hypothetical protein
MDCGCASVGLIERPEQACASFEADCARLIAGAQELKAAVVLGGLYPNDAYDAAHYARLQAMDRSMRGWKGVHAVLPFLTAVDDGKGHWPAQLMADAAHPNALGHRRMFEAIDIPQVFDPIARQLLAAPTADAPKPSAVTTDQKN